jgi:excisionase family DNA binding protein
MNSNERKKSVLHDSAASNLDQTFLVTQEQAAAFLHCSLATLRRWVREDRLRPIKLGRRVLFRAEDLNAMVRPKVEANDA